MTMLPECSGTWGPPAEWCAWVEPDPATGAPAPPPREAAAAVAREVVATLQLPSAYPHVGPDPTWNEWNRAIVGHPLWLWVDGPRTLNTANSDYGITVTLTARHTSTNFTMGDGRTVKCATTTPYGRETVESGAPSPDCGHIYQQPPRTGSHQVTATTHWAVDWTAAGHSGTLPTTMTGTRDLPVGELQAVVIRR